MNNTSFRSFVSAFVVITAFLLSRSHAQSVNFKNYNSENGLPSDEVYHMYQDVNGVMWFATDRGLCRYNGYSFETLDINDGLPSSTVFRFYPQENGDIWCSTINNRFFIFNPKDYKIRLYEYNDLLNEHSYGRTNDDLQVYSDGSIRVSYIATGGFVSISADGKLTEEIEFPIGTDDSIYYCIEKDPISEGFSYGSMDEPDNPDVVSVQIAPKRKFNYHKARDLNGIQVFSDELQVYMKSGDEQIKHLETNDRCIGIGRVNEDYFYLGFTFSGVTLFDNRGNPWKTFLDGESVSSFFVDHEEGVWITTISSGVYYARSLDFEQYSFEHGRHVVEFGKGNSADRLYLSLNNGPVCKYENGDFEIVISEETRFRGFSYCQHYSPLGLMVCMDESREELSPHIRNEGTVFIGVVRSASDEVDRNPILASSSGFFVLGKERYSFYNIWNSRVEDVCENDGKVFLGMDDGLFGFDTLTKRTWSFDHKLAKYAIKDLDLFKSNSLILATQGAGVVFVDGDDLWNIASTDGLSSNLVTEVYIENDSTIWACTNKGVDRIRLYKTGKFSIKSLGVEDGLAGNDVLDIQVVNEKVWVATRSGLCTFPISLMDAEKKERDYFLRILETKVNDVVAASLIDLPYWKNRVEINFEGISYRQIDGLTYRYKLVGVENKWTYTKDMKVVYQSLPPGEYHFYLQAGVKDMWGTKIIKFPIVVLPPFYTTLWFKSLILLLIVALAYLFFKFRILSYNRDITRELLRQLLKRLRGEDVSFVVRSKGQDVKILSNEVLYVQSSGNYLEIHTEKERFLVREKISSFLDLVPDPIEYVQVRRSHIVRIDKVEAKSVNSITISGEEIKVGEKYLSALSKIQL